MNRKRLTVGAAIAGAAVAAVLPATNAVSQESPPSTVVDVELHDTAVLDARGAVALVRVQLACSPGSSGYVIVQLAQRSGSGIAQGYTDRQVTCDGTIQELELPVPASDKPFKQGPAFAEATGQVFGPFGFATDTDSEEITLVKR